MLSPLHGPVASKQMHVATAALATAQDLSTYLTSFLVAALCVATVVAAFVQFFAPLSASIGQRIGVLGWLGRSIARSIDVARRLGSSDGAYSCPRWLHEALDQVGAPVDQVVQEAEHRIAVGREEFGDYSTVGHMVPRAWRAGWKFYGRHTIIGRTGTSDETFMYAVQGALRDAIAAPSTNPSLFMLATVGMSARREIMPLMIVDVLARRSPELVAKLAGVQSGIGDEAADLAVRMSPSSAATALASLDDSASRALERNLDDLQRGLAKVGAWATRLLAIAFGLGGALAAEWLLRAPSDATSLSVGVTGGVLAILLRDALSSAAARFAR